MAVRKTRSLSRACGIEIRVKASVSGHTVAILPRLHEHAPCGELRFDGQSASCCERAFFLDNLEGPALPECGNPRHMPKSHIASRLIETWEYFQHAGGSIPPAQ